MRLSPDHLSLQILKPLRMLLPVIMVSVLLQRGFTRPLGIGIISHSLFLHASSRTATCDASLKASPSTNPLLWKDGIPRFKEIKPEHVVPALEADLSKLKEEFKGTIHFDDINEFSEHTNHLIVNWNRFGNQFEGSQANRELESAPGGV